MPRGLKLKTKAEINKAAKKKKTPKSIAEQIGDTLKEKLSGEKAGT